MHKKNSVAEQRWKTIIIIKDFFLVDSGLLLDFWVEIMDITNYLQNCLSTKSWKKELIPKKSLIREKQNISNLKVFSSFISIVIFKKKRQLEKSNI